MATEYQLGHFQNEKVNEYIFVTVSVEIETILTSDMTRFLLFILYFDGENLTHKSKW